MKAPSMPPLSSYYPVAVSELLNFKAGTLVRFSSRNPELDLGFGSFVVFTYPLKDDFLLVVSYSLQAREQTEALIHTLFSQKEADKLKEVSQLLKKADWHFAAVHYGMIMDIDDKRILIDGHYWLPQAAQTLLDRRIRKPEKITVKKITAARKQDFEQRLKETEKLFRQKH